MRIVLIDPWLADTGGHNYQYALDLLQAAQQHGYEVALATNRSLPQTVHLPLSWQVVRAFRFGACTRHWLGPDGRNPHPCDLDGAWLAADTTQGSARPDSLLERLRQSWRRFLDWSARYDRHRRIVDFARGCSRVLDELRPRRGDLFFLPSLSEFDFLGVARFLRDDPRTRDFLWHLQFHFNFLVGRDPEFSEQGDRLRRLQLQFHEALQQIPDHELRFYATTGPMARQYDHLGIASFQPLPYPVRQPAGRTGNGGEGTTESTPPAGPIRVTFAGGMRREKGKKKLGALIATVWPDCLAPGHMQFVFQSPARQIAGWLPRTLRAAVQISSSCDNRRSHIQTVGHPLSADAYADLIRRTGLGVFLYDSRRYYARASGILGEMLAAGAPVIVPAGCWLADQVAGEIYRHVAELADRQEWVVEKTELGLTVKTGCLEANSPLPPNTSDLVVQLGWPRQLAPGVYLEIGAEFRGAEGASIADPQLTVLGPSQTLAGALLPVPPGAQQVRIRLRSAYTPCEVTVDHARMVALRPPDGHRHHPRGSVGLTAAHEQQYPELLREVLAHYPHYRATAQRFAVDWLECHHPERTLELIRRNGATARGGSASPNYGWSSDVAVGCAGP